MLYLLVAVRQSRTTCYCRPSRFTRHFRFIRTTVTHLYSIRIADSYRSFCVVSFATSQG